MNTTVGLVLGVVGLMVSGVVLAWRLPEWVCLVIAVTVVLAAAVVMAYWRRRAKAKPAPEDSLLYTIRAPPAWQDPAAVGMQEPVTTTTQTQRDAAALPDGMGEADLAADDAPAPGEDRLWRRRPRG